MHRLAAHGVSGSGQALPYQGQIQAAFGRHDVSGITAHVGGQAAEATTAMGAEGYAVGEHVAFAGKPDLHTAAHEATHCLQQQGGVALKGGVGQTGDSYEKHADAVADAVVAGRSAEGLLDRGLAGGASSGTAVQLKPKDKDKDKDAQPKEKHEPTKDEHRGKQESEGDAGYELRMAVLKSAEGWAAGGKDYITQLEIDSTRVGNATFKVGETKDGQPMHMVIDGQRPPMKNYTTCIEFSGKTMVDAMRELHAGNSAEQKALLAQLHRAKRMFDKEKQLHATAAAFHKQMNGWLGKSLARATKSLEEAQKGVDELKQEPGEAPEDAAGKRAEKRRKILLKHKERYLRQIGKHFNKAQELFNSAKAKVQAALSEAEQVKEDNTAMTRVTPPLGDERPLPGEYVYLAQPPKKTKYGVGEDTQVPLAPGAFLHICIMQSVEKVDEDLELWHTIDGGKTKAEKKQRYVQPKTGLMYYQHPDTKGGRASFQVGGWSDSGAMAAGASEEAAAKKTTKK